MSRYEKALILLTAAALLTASRPTGSAIAPLPPVPMPMVDDAQSHITRDMLASLPR